MYAKQANIAVTTKAPNFSSLLISTAARIEIPVTTNMLKAAEPTKTMGPIGLGGLSTSFKMLKQHRKISGAEEPSAMSVTLATCSFHLGTSTLITLSVPLH